MDSIVRYLFNRLPVILFVALASGGALSAQSMEPDEEGCTDSQLLTRMPKTRLSECSVKDFDAAELLTGPMKIEDWQRKTVEGKTEILNYQCPGNISLLQIARNMEAAMRQAGYQIVFSGKGDDNDQPVVTGRKGAQWIEIRTYQNGETPNYRQTAVTVQDMKQEVAANADGWAAEIEKSGKVSVYGINFETGKAVVTPESEPVLQEIANLLQQRPEWKLRIVGHTDNTGGKAANQALSQRRAAAVAAWLTAKGIDRARLASEGLGDTSPVADNTTEEGRGRNRRVELIKL